MAQQITNIDEMQKNGKVLAVIVVEYDMNGMQKLNIKPTSRDNQQAPADKSAARAPESKPNPTTQSRPAEQNRAMPNQPGRTIKTNAPQRTLGTNPAMPHITREMGDQEKLPAEPIVKRAPENQAKQLTPEQIMQIMQYQRQYAA